MKEEPVDEASLAEDRIEPALSRLKSEKKRRLAEARTVIHGCAAAIGLGSGALSLLPGLTVFGNTVSLSLGITAMVSALAKLFDRKMDKTTSTAFVSSILGYVVGVLGVSAISAFIPVVGVVVNASTAFIVVESIGWGVYFIFDSGREPTKLSRNEIEDFLRMGKLYAEQEKTSEEQQ